MFNEKFILHLRFLYGISKYTHIMKSLSPSVLFFASKSASVAPQVREALEESGVSFEYTYNIQKACDYLSDKKPCLLLFDTDPDDARAAELCRKIKKIKEELLFEVCFLVDDNKNFEMLWNWFKLGVDEFGLRDTNINLTIQRIQCILKRYIISTKVVPENGFLIDRERYLVYVNGQEIVLPRKEFELLMLLSSKPEKVFTRDEIFRQVWGNRLIVGDRTIDVHIRKIREKIGEDYIVTVKGVGYKFQEI